MTTTLPKQNLAVPDLSRRPIALGLLLALCSTYAAFTMISNIGSLRIVNVWGLVIDAGTLLYPFTFILRDLIHKSGGIKVARIAVVTAAGLNGLASLFYWIVSILPPDASTGAQTEFGHVLAMSWRIVLASVLSQLVSELVDTEVYQRWENKFGKRYQEGRVVVSNLVSVPLDSILFTLIAFAGTLPVVALIGVIVGNIVLKYLVATVLAPMIRFIPPVVKTE